MPRLFLRLLPMVVSVAMATSVQDVTPQVLGQAPTFTATNRTRVAAVSYVPQKFDLSGNADRLEKAFREAAAGGAQLICNDRWNAQLARIAQLDGAQLLVIPAYGSRSESQDTAVLSRGREMGVPVVEANVGVSLVVDQGQVAAVARQDMGITFADITIPDPKPPRAIERDRVEREFLQWRETEMQRRYQKTRSKLGSTVVN